MKVFVGRHAEVSCRGLLVRTVTLTGSFRTKWICSICRYTMTSFYFCVLVVELLAVREFCPLDSREGISLEQLLSLQLKQWLVSQWGERRTAAWTAFLEPSMDWLLVVAKSRIPVLKSHCLKNSQ